ncbi:MAG: VanZ family protein [Pseudomonadales bacterium]
MSALINKLLALPLLLRQLFFWATWSAATAVMLLPTSSLPTVNIWDKAEHAGTFATLMTLAWLAYQHRFSHHILVLSLVLYGVTTECIQHFIPSRSFSVLDMVADTVGVLFAWLLIRLLEKQHGA